MKTERQQEKSMLFNALVFIALTLCAVVLTILCIYNVEQLFVQKYARLLSVFAAILLLALGGVCVWLIVKQKTFFLRTLLSVYLFIIILAAFVFILQRTGFFKIVKDEQAFQDYLEKSGAWMPIVYILLQYLQVVVLPIPSVVSTVAGVAVFGPFMTVVYSLIGILLGSFTAFFIGRKLGAKAVAWMIGEDMLSKWQNKLKGKDNVLLTLMFLLPVFPDDVLCFVAGLSSMTTRYFVIMIIISRILSVTTTSYSFGFIPFDTPWGIAIWIGLFALLGIVFWIATKHFDALHAWHQKLTKRFKKNQ